MSGINQQDIHTFLESSQMGFWKLEITEGCKMKLYADSTANSLLGTPNDLDPQERFAFHASHIHEDEKGNLEGWITELLQGGGEIVYRYIHPENGEMTLRCFGKQEISEWNCIRMIGSLQRIDGITLKKQDKTEDVHNKLYRDALTGTYNRWYYEDFVRNMEGEVAVAVMDLDNFKEKNDGYGHSGGDATLKMAVGIMKREIRKYDAVIRYGGDEFLLVFPGMTAPDLYHKLEGIRKKISQTVVPGFVNLRLTVSIGGVIKEKNEKMEDAVQRADRLMYQAKALKNRIVMEQQLTE